MAPCYPYLSYIMIMLALYTEWNCPDNNSSSLLQNSFQRTYVLRTPKGFSIDYFLAFAYYHVNRQSIHQFISVNQRKHTTLTLGLLLSPFITFQGKISNYTLDLRILSRTNLLKSVIKNCKLYAPYPIL